MIIPPRLLPININSVVPEANWNSGEEDDPFNGFPYRWTVQISVSSQPHSYPLSQSPFAFTGNDIIVGDWLSDFASGAAVKIIAINSQASDQVEVVVEDIDQFNTYTDPSGSGNGVPGAGSGMLYQLGDDGLPILGPMSLIYTALQANNAWQLDQISRFRYRNLLHSYYRVNQPGHSFAVGDTVYLQPDGSYAAVDPTNVTVVSAIGSVNSIRVPSVDWFTFRPVGRVVQNLSPALPGVPGELIYLTQSGLSNVAPSRWSTPQYIQLETATSGVALNRGVDTAGTVGFVNRTYVVPDQDTANATLLTTNTGDQVMVDNAGYGEWTHYVVHQNSLRAISTQDSARVDAESLEVTITSATSLQNVTVNGVTMHGLLMGNISAGRSITSVSVQVSESFDANSVITVGTATVADVIMPSVLIDLTEPGIYGNNPAVDFIQAYTPIYAFVANASPGGNAVVTVSYL